MRLTKIYTKVGDKGQTMLASGEKVPKTSARVEAYGTIDELNAYLGFWRDLMRESAASKFSDLIEELGRIQNEMHDIGGELCTPEKALDTTRQQVVQANNTERLERHMDGLNEELSPLENFVLPGGHTSNSAAHICRALCRRAERRVLALAEEEPIRDEPRIYLNRLSDWIFVASRTVSQRLGSPEVLWQQTKSRRTDS